VAKEKVRKTTSHGQQSKYARAYSDNKQPGKRGVGGGSGKDPTQIKLGQGRIVAQGHGGNKVSKLCKRRKVGYAKGHE